MRCFPSTQKLIPGPVQSAPWFNQFHTSRGTLFGHHRLNYLVVELFVVRMENYHGNWQAIFRTLISWIGEYRSCHNREIS